MNKNEKHITLLIQFGQSDLSEAMIQSGLHFLASSCLTSGSGSAITNITDWIFVEAHANFIGKDFWCDTSIRKSTPDVISSRDVFFKIVVFVRVSLNLFTLSALPGQKNPFLSHTNTFSGLAPKAMMNLTQAKSAVQAPLKMIISPQFYFLSFPLR